MTSKPEIKITSRKQNINKIEKNKKPIHSNFFITLNLNQQYHKDEHKANIDDDMEIFDGLLVEFLNHIEHYVRLPEGVEYNDNNVKDVSADYVVELGSIKKQIHAHIMVKFTHHTKIQLNFGKIKEFFKKKLGLKNVYMQAKLLRMSSSENIIDYLEKMT
jgi:hypothetical protein